MHPHSLPLTILMLGAGLLAATPSEAGPHLLPEGTRPAAFILSGNSGDTDKPVSLRSYLGHRRIVLLFTPSQRCLDIIAAEREQLEERDLTVFAIVTPDNIMGAEISAGPIRVLVDREGRVTHEYGVGNGRPAFYLIGKDGHIAVARHGYPTPQELFGIIDAMPMRRQEMRERHGR